MPESLYLTPTRAALLQHIRAGWIRRDPVNTQIRYEDAETRTNLTARTADVIRAGWAEEGERESTSVWPILLTPKGKQVLAEWEKSRNA